MIPAAFDYIRPSTVEDAVNALADAGEEGKVLAGGQSLLPVLRLRLAAPALLVDLGGLSQLRGIREDGDMLVIGAMTTHAELAASSVPLLAQVAATVGDRQVRHRGTLGGSLSHADPAGDLPTAAVALDAQMVLAGPHGRRTVAASDFFVDLFTTALAPDELLIEVRVPKLQGWQTHYTKVGRTAQAWATVAVAAAVRRENGSIAQARVALTNMGPTPVRASAVEQALAGVAVDGDAIAAAAAHAAEGTAPASDTTASAEYRSHLAKVLTRRALLAAVGR
ncbi:carbon-monoxide dehydrogenase medium subunit [Rhizocola hellebori]|uniref:Carbon-monoxide dehydrogenase medium subunit n=1 Tax=Rhizocola hellebori TaxID=1392758 RepID=A0A8J3Q9S6_9ACTN|nr:xanthine dehydrogenase family protein subunit M [Rhizocola hellebori]GIH05675.1 carbon-monoxide dehydrogenase medium subunit [Rhizocola hellebori]